MASPPPSDVRVFIGAPITDRTEQRFLAHARQSLEAAGESAVILANFELGSARRQVDFLIATASQAVAVELKGYRHAVIGSESGEWCVGVGGGARSVGFPYAQARDNRFLVADALRLLLPRGSDARAAIAGMLCIYPEVPRGSSLPSSGHKLTIGSFSDFMDLMRRPSLLPLPICQWEQLAASLNLSPVSAAESDAEAAIVGEFLAHCADLAEATAGPFVEAHVDSGNGQETLPPLVPILAESGRVHLVGPSGVGKTRLVARLIAEAARGGMFPLAVAARDFDGQLLPLLRKSVARSTGRRFETVMRAAEATGSRILVCVDALNECPRDRLSELIASLQTAALRYGATILLTGQALPELPASLQGKVIRLAQPDRERARTLTEAHLGRPLESSEQNMLEVVASAQDASVLAEVLARHGSVDARFALYDAFTTGRLPETAHRHDLHAALGELAARLRESYATKIAASAAARLLGRAMPDGVTGSQALAEAEAAALLVKEDGCVRFRHDLIGDYFTADRLLRLTEEENLAQEAARPINRELQQFVLGGASIAVAVARLLDTSISDGTIDAALYGRCGELPRHMLLDRCREVVDRIEAAYTKLSFSLPIEGDGPPARAALAFPVPFDLSPRELKAASALSAAVNAGMFETVMQMLFAIDEHLWSEARRLRAEHPDLKRNIPAMVFGSLYGEHFQPKGGALLQQLFSNISNERIFRTGVRPDFDINAELDGFEEKSPGQLFLLLAMHRSQFGADLGLPSRAAELIPFVWSRGIYHLRLMLMDMVHLNGRGAPDGQRQEIFEILNGYLSDNAWMNWILVDAISAVGALEFGITVEGIVAEYEQIAGEPISEETGRRALSAYVATYDHPASDLYCEAFYEGISTPTRSAVLVRALADPTADPMSLDFAIRDLGRYPSDEAVPQLKKLSLTPIIGTSSMQASVAVFAEAIGQLGRMGEGLPPIADLSANATLRAWQQVRPLIYAFNTAAPTTQGVINALWAAFREAGAGAALDVLLRLMRDSQVFKSGARLNFIASCRDGMRVLCLAAIEPGYAAETLFPVYDRAGELVQRHRQFALACLGEVGRSSDRERVERWLEDAGLGADAVRTLRAIQAR